LISAGAIALLVAAAWLGVRALRCHVADSAAEETMGWLRRETLPQLEMHREKRGCYPPTLLSDLDIDFHPLARLATDTSGAPYLMPYGEWQAAPVSYAPLSGKDGRPGQRSLLCAVKGAGGLGFPGAVLSKKHEPARCREWLEYRCVSGHSLQELVGTADPLEAMGQAEARAKTASASDRQVALLDAAGLSLYANERDGAMAFAKQALAIDADSDAGEYAGRLVSQLAEAAGGPGTGGPGRPVRRFECRLPWTWCAQRGLVKGIELAPL